MTDSIDLAQDVYERNTELMFETFKRRAEAVSLRPNGCCHNPYCREEVEGSKIFCDSECAREYEKYKLLKSWSHQR
jgi:hypothetical protein